MTNSLNKILTDSLRKDAMVGFLKTNPTLFEETIKVSLGDEKPQSWRAAWLVKHYMQRNDKHIRPKINSILKVILNKEDGHQRELLKILIDMELNERQEGILFDKCIRIWEDISKSPSVRGFAFLIITNTVKKYPELISEISFLAQNHFIETLSPGIRHSVIRIVKEMKMEL